MMNLESYREKVNDFLAINKQAKASVEQEEKELQITEEKLDHTLEAQSITQVISQSLQEKAQNQIAGVVSRCLEAVFPNDPYEFEIRLEMKRGKTEAKLVFIHDRIELDDPLNEVGGGVIDVASLGLRLACILLLRPAPRRLLVLDEPFANIRGKENRLRTRQMLIALAEDMGLQIIINTDISNYRLGTVIELTK